MISPENKTEPGPAISGDPLPQSDRPSFWNALGRIFTAEQLFDAGQAEKEWGSDTSGVDHPFLGAVMPQTREQIIELVQLANQFAVPLYTVSTGNNWGYGSSRAVRPGSLLVSLARMKRVVAFDEQLGVVTIEPGVTQADLRRFLDETKAPFLVPVHGGGPHCSLIGNALERGYGITPIADHFAAVQSIEVVLADGRVYRPSLTTLGAEQVDGLFKWGIGPHLDAIFTQSNLGIVTQMTIALARVPESTTAFYFWIQQDGQLEEAVERVRGALRRCGGLLGSINLMNARRLLAMRIPYSKEAVGSDGIWPDSLVGELSRTHQVPAWMGLGSIFGSQRLTAAARTEIRQILKPVASKLIFLDERRVHRMTRIGNWIPGFWKSALGGIVRAIESSYRLISGTPSTIALPLAYWRSGAMPDGGDMNPAKDGCGLRWYAPLVPMDPAQVRAFVTMVERICRAHGIEPLITLTSLSERCFDCTIPLLFDRQDAASLEQARAAHRALFAEGKKQGWVPYRVGVDQMELVVDSSTVYWQIVEQIKTTLDPKGILAPGRYAP